METYKYLILCIVLIFWLFEAIPWNTKYSVSYIQKASDSSDQKPQFFWIFHKKFTWELGKLLKSMRTLSSASQKIFLNLKSRNRNPFRFLDVCSASIFHCNEAARWCFFVCSSEINIESNRIVDHYRTSRPRPVYNQTITNAGQLSMEYNQNIINGQLSIEYN